MSNYVNKNTPLTNQKIMIDADFNPNSICFSNNDTKLSIVGANELIIVSTLSDKIEFRFNLPEWQQI